jgi:hypothetical protein
MRSHLNAPHHLALHGRLSLMARCLSLSRPRLPVRLRLSLIHPHAIFFLDYDLRNERNPARPEQHVATRVAPESRRTWNLGHIPDMHHR